MTVSAAAPLGLQVGRIPPSGYQSSSHLRPLDTLKLGDIERTLTKVGDQGNSAITYKVDEGWPDPTTHANVVAYAKKGKTLLEKFEEEIKWLTRIDDLLANGVYESYHWIVLRGVADKMDLASTPWYWKNKLSEDYNKCIQEIQPKLDAVITVVKDYVDKFRVLHLDLQPGNILWDEKAQHPSLIDWGRAEEAAHCLGSYRSEVAAFQYDVFNRFPRNEKTGPPGYGLPLLQRPSSSVIPSIPRIDTGNKCKGNGGVCHYSAHLHNPRNR
ncbi:hypothetical protein IMY05_C4845000500 [Salix suchowensis]|nr:hypothetical protein IMY05_C4845000500 [Salix suchowensis]